MQDIKRARDKLMAYDQMYGQTARWYARKTMAKPRHDLDQTCLKWFRQLQGIGVFVQTTEVKAAAEKCTVFSRPSKISIKPTGANGG